MLSGLGRAGVGVDSTFSEPETPTTHFRRMSGCRSSATESTLTMYHRASIKSVDVLTSFVFFVALTLPYLFSFLFPTLNSSQLFFSLSLSRPLYLHTSVFAHPPYFHLPSISQEDWVPWIWLRAGPWCSIHMKISSDHHSCRSFSTQP
jgi:hypothetical protein